MRLRTLVETSERVRATSSKKEKISLIAGLIGRARGNEISLVAYFLSGMLPGGRIGVGWGTVREAAADLQAVTASLELLDVQAYLDDLQRLKGPGSQERKRHVLRDLFSRVNGEERGFLIKLLLGELRQGALEGLLIEAIAEASSLSASAIRQALMFSGDIGVVARMAMEEGASGLGRIAPVLFRPVSPMLASPATGEEEALVRLGEAAWEFKIDGARIQIHKDRDDVRIFSRSLKDVTGSLPEIVALAENFQMDEAIVEGEVIALRPDKRPLPFQTTMRRFGRILDVARLKEEIPLFPYFFDLLYLEGEAFFERPYQERFQMLSELAPHEYLIPRIITGRREEAAEFLVQSLGAGHEGLMAKGLQSPYMAGHRGFQWLKIKPARTLDLVVLAAEWGHGRRRGRLSNLHLGARDPESGQFVMLGKTFKGLTDRMLDDLTRRLLALEVDRDSYTVYVRPELVLEIAYNDVQESPRYPGGLALRFARVKRIRTDKTASAADTIQTVWSVFEASRL